MQIKYRRTTKQAHAKKVTVSYVTDEPRRSLCLAKHKDKLIKPLTVLVETRNLNTALVIVTVNYSQLPILNKPQAEPLARISTTELSNSLLRHSGLLSSAKRPFAFRA